MGKRFTDFSQLPKGAFGRGKPEEVKPLPKTETADSDAAAALAYVTRPSQGRPKATPLGSGKVAHTDRTAELEAALKAARAEIDALRKERDELERVLAERGRELDDARVTGEAAERDRERLQGEVARLRGELKAAEKRADAPPAVPEPTLPVPAARADGLLVMPGGLSDAFPGELREQTLAALADALAAARQAGRERRSAVLAHVLEANPSSGELERRRKALRQTIKNADFFVDGKILAELERLGFRYVSGRKHWKLDYAGIRIPMAKTPSDYRAGLNVASDIANRCF
ncbi:MAG: hypothetical protein J6334_09805 [Kiritimatiellae bacterium]|nr:hypothetical protein [Kiritimatiellia bacterium]